MAGAGQVEGKGWDSGSFTFPSGERPQEVSEALMWCGGCGQREELGRWRPWTRRWKVEVVARAGLSDFPPISSPFPSLVPEPGCL